MGELSWQKRLAIVLSFAWLALVGAISSSESDRASIFLMLGALPVAFCWGISWVWAGFRKQRITTPGADIESPTEAPVSRATLFTWIATILFAAGIGIFYYAFAKTDVEPAGKIGYLVGFYFWVPILVYVIWKSTFKKRRGVGALLFAAAFVGIAVYQSHVMLQEQEDASHLQGRAQTMMLKLMNGELIDKAELSDVGQYSSVLLVTHDFVSQVMNDFQTLNTKFETSGVETMLAPETLQNPRAIDQAIMKLMSLSTLIDDTEERIKSHYNEFPRMIDSADIPYQVKAEFKKGAENGVKRGKAALIEYFKIERALIGNAVEMLNFMKQRQGQFMRQGDQILFKSQADADKYNHYMQIIQSLALEESEWRNKQFSSSARQIEQFQQLK